MQLSKLVLCIWVLYLHRTAVANLNEFIGPYINSAIAGQNLFSLPDITTPEECAKVCNDHNECMTFEIGSSGCYGSSLTRLQAGEAYQYDSSFSLYERLEKPTDATCLTCSFPGNGACEYVPTVSDTAFCDWDYVENYGFRSACSYGKAILESPWFVLQSSTCFASIIIDPGAGNGCSDLTQTFSVQLKSTAGEIETTALQLVQGTFGRCVFKVEFDSATQGTKQLVISNQFSSTSKLRLVSITMANCNSRKLHVECPADIRLLTSESHAVVSWSSPFAHYSRPDRGSCSESAITCSSDHENNASFDIGATDVTIQCTDLFGQTAACQFLVEVVSEVDTSSPSPTVTTLPPPCDSNCKGHCYRNQCVPKCPAGYYDIGDGYCTPFPRPPINVKAFQKSRADEVFLDWDAPHDDTTVRGFRLNRLRQGDTKPHVEDVGYPVKPLHFNDPYPSQFEYKVTGLEPTVYFLFLVSYNEDGVESSASTPIKVDLRVSTPETTTSHNGDPSSSISSSNRVTTKVVPSSWTVPTIPLRTTTSTQQPSTQTTKLQTIMVAGSVFCSLLATFFLGFYVWRRKLARSRISQQRSRPQQRRPQLQGPRWNISLSSELKSLEEKQDELPLMQSDHDMRNICLDEDSNTESMEDDIEMQLASERINQVLQERASQKYFILGTGIHLMDDSDEEDGEDNVDDDDEASQTLSQDGVQPLIDPMIPESNQLEDSSHNEMDDE